MGSLVELKRTSRAALCLECGKCSTMCPLAPFGGFSAARMMSIQDPETEIHGHADAVERCLTCGSCEVRCPQGVRYTEFVRGLRAELPPSARSACPHGEVLQTAARIESDAPTGVRDLSWIGDGLEIAEEGEIALFVGCLPLFDAVFGDDLEVEMVAIARAAIRLLNHLGIRPVVAPDERCCGHDLLWGGETEAFSRLAEANLAAFRRRGVNRILTTCAECCRTWRADYPALSPNGAPQVLHMAEFLAEKAAAGELGIEDRENRSDGVESATFHDPCRLGRHLGVFAAPRSLLGELLGADLVEMERSGRDAVCCGTSGFTHCDAVSRRLQTQRLSSAADTGAAKLLTACPKCMIHLRCAQSEDRRNGRGGEATEIEDLTVLAARILTEPPRETGACE